MRDKIWYELVQIKFGDKYLALYISRQYKLVKTFKVFTLIFSGSGVFGWQLWEPIAWIALILISIVQLFGLIENQIIRSDSEVVEISRLRELYVSYFNKLEKLWVDYENERVNEKEASEIFYQLRNSDHEAIESLDNKIGIKKWKKLVSLAEFETQQYIKNYHN